MTNYYDYSGYGLEGSWKGGFGAWYDKSALQRLTTALSAKAGISVAEGAQWCYDSKNKVLYYNPADFSCMHIDAIFGIILHEIGHALFTPATPLDKVSSLFEKYPHQLGWLLNSLENRRIERRLKEVHAHSPKFVKEAFDATLYKRETYKEEKERLEKPSWWAAYGYGWDTKEDKSKKEKPSPLSWWLAEEIDRTRWGSSVFEKGYPMPKKLKEVLDKAKPNIAAYEAADDFEGAACPQFHAIAEIVEPILEEEETREFKAMIIALVEGGKPCLSSKEDFPKTARELLEDLFVTTSIGGIEAGGKYEDLNSYEKIRKRVLPQAHALVSKLKPLLLERKKIREDFGYRSGKLDVPRLWKHRVGSTRLFRKVEMSEGFTLPPFALVADFSSSMSSQDVKLAVDSMALFSIALTSLKTPHAIFTFSDDAQEVKPLTTRQMSQTSIGLCEGQKRGGTNDFKALELVSETFAKNKVKGKPIVIVFTDGRSNAPEILQCEITKLETKFGALVIGIGINTTREDIAKYKHAVRISNTSELPKTIGSLLKSNLTKLLRSR